MRLVAMLLIASCAHRPSPLLRRASFDLRCPTPAVSMIDLGHRTVGASGCGTTVTYTKHCTDMWACYWAAGSARKTER